MTTAAKRRGTNLQYLQSMAVKAAAKSKQEQQQLEQEQEQELKHSVST